MLQIENDLSANPQNSDSNGSIFISSNQFNEFIGVMPTMDHDQIFDIDANLYEHFANDIEHEESEIFDSRAPINASNTHDDGGGGVGAATLENLKKTRNPKLSTFPRILQRQSQKIEAFVSIFMDLNGLTWVRFRVDRSLKIPTIHVCQTYFHKTAYDKMHLWDMLASLEEIVSQIPKCDVYIIENILQGSYRQKIGKKQVYDIVHLNQCVSMVVAMLTTRNAGQSYTTDPNVVFMGRDVMGRYFNLFVVNETTSTEIVVRQLLEKKIPAINGRMSNEDIRFEPNILRAFDKSSKVKREYLGKTLLIGLTYFRLNLLQTTGKSSAKSEKKLTN